MKLADMQVLEACPARGAGSNPARATFLLVWLPCSYES